jgi:hypothetical protein
MTDQDTGKFRTNTKDQYYTKGSVAKTCVDRIVALCPYATDYVWIEPSAGSGAFLKAVPTTVDSKLGLDIDPQSADVVSGNFLSWTPPADLSGQKLVFFGNPPFGKQGSLAKAFISRAAQWADIIAFVLPRSFVKPSMTRAYPMKFHCIFSEELAKDSFEVNGVCYDVPCVFQIWLKKAVDRPLVAAVVAKGFQYVKAGSAYHIAFRRVGGNAGKCYTGVGPFNAQTHYFVLLEPKYVGFIERIVSAVNNIVFPTNTVGPRSLSKSEANTALNGVLDHL